MESLERGVFGFYSARHARRDPAAKIALQNFINFNIMIKQQRYKSGVYHEQNSTLFLSTG
jgi:hypothetical protein